MGDSSLFFPSIQNVGSRDQAQVIIQVYPQAPLPTEPSHQPSQHSFIHLNENLQTPQPWKHL